MRSNRFSRRGLVLAVTAMALVASCGSAQNTASGGSNDASPPVAGMPCEPGPDASIVADDSVASDRRGEALVLHLTGINELVVQAEDEGVDIVYDDPNYGGVWGDGAGGWVVAVVDCSVVDPDRIAEIAGGADAVRLIEVRWSFDEVNGFRDDLVAELRASGVDGDVAIDSTLTGRQIRVVVERLDQLVEGFGSALPPGSFTVEEGPLLQKN